MKKLSLYALPLGAALMLAGCGSQPVKPAAYTGPTYEAAAANPFINSSRKAVDTLVQGIDLQQVGQAPVLVATVVNINDLGQSAPLGRTLGELYASQLASNGLNVIEMKLRGSVYVREGAGELLLSREIRDIAAQHNAALVLVGTYSAASQYTFISMKLVRTADSRIVRSHDYAIPNDRDVLRMLRQ